MQQKPLNSSHHSNTHICHHKTNTRSAWMMLCLNAIWIILLSSQLLSCGQSGSPPNTPPTLFTPHPVPPIPHTPIMDESDIKRELQVPDNASHVVILSQTAHMDWDWQNTFPVNYNRDGSEYNSKYWGDIKQPAQTILSNAAVLLNASDNSERYYYSTCEVSFVKKFAEDTSVPSNYNFQKLVNATTPDGSARRYRIVGGGMTSPDNLLPAGETFIRDFLVGKTWMEDNSLEWTGQIWIPDDFGNDPQLPIVLQAMAAKAVGFSRIPCQSTEFASAPYCMQFSFADPPDDGLVAAQLLLDSESGGLDFIWQAADKSKILAHYIPDHYSQGEYIKNNASISEYLNINAPVSKTPYIYIPVSADFMLPVGGAKNVADISDPAALRNIANQWNSQNCQPNDSGGCQYYVVVATFDHYARLVTAHTNKLKTRAFHPNSDQSVELFRSTPYFTGFYATRPKLKQLHHQGTRDLLATETLDAIQGVLKTTADAPEYHSPDLFQAWLQLVESNHHDFITGTAIDGVYYNEQLVNLSESHAAAAALVAKQMSDIANNIETDASHALVVFNQLGFERSGLVSYPNTSGIPCDYQTADNSSCLYYTNAKSLGYNVNGINDASSIPHPVSLDSSAHFYTLKNEYLSATIDGSSGTITKFTDGSNSSSIFHGAANELVFYKDNGGLYTFGYEVSQGTHLHLGKIIIPGSVPSTPAFQLLQTTASVNDVITTFSNKLQANITIPLTIKSSSPTFTEAFTVTYTINTGEPFLRVAITGQAPADTAPSPNWGTSVFVKFPLSTPITRLEHGTPYHWDHKKPWNFQKVNASATAPVQRDFSAIFQATHDFVLARDTHNKYRAAIYHSSVPAWAVATPEQALYGCILRNNPLTGITHISNLALGASGNDSETHTIEYAIGVPSTLQSPETGVPLRIAKTYNTPLRAHLLSKLNSSGVYPTQFSLASLDSSAAFITAAKRGTKDPGNLILRLYQPSNSSQSLKLTLASDITTSHVQELTALEETLDNSYNTSSHSCTIPIEHALKTVGISNVFQ